MARMALELIYGGSLPALTDGQPLRTFNQHQALRDHDRQACSHKRLVDLVSQVLKRSQHPLQRIPIAKVPPCAMVPHQN